MMKTPEEAHSGDEVDARGVSRSLSSFCVLSSLASTQGKDRAAGEGVERGDAVDVEAVASEAVALLRRGRERLKAETEAI